MEDNTVQQPVNQPTPPPSPYIQPVSDTPNTPQPITPPEMGSAFDLFSPSMAALKLNIKAYLGMYGLIVLLGIIAGIMSAATTKVTGSEVATGTSLALNSGSLILGFAIIVLAILLGPAITYVQLQSAKGNKVQLSEAITTGAKFIFRFIGLAILVSVLIMGGLILFIIPGLIMVRRYFLSAYLLIDKNIGIIEAMKQSAALTKPYSSKVWGIVGVNILISLPSFIPIIGTIISSVLQLLYSFAPAIRYIQLDNATNNVATPGMPMPNTTGV